MLVRLAQVSLVMACLRYAIAEPERVKKLVLSSPAGGLIRLRKAFYARLFLSILLPGGSAGKRIMQWLFADRFQLDNPVVRQLIGIKTLRPRMKVYPGIFAASELARIAGPVYVLFGEREVLYNPNPVAKRARRLMPTASVGIVPSAGHLLTMESPKFVNQRIMSFLLER